MEPRPDSWTKRGVQCSKCKHVLISTYNHDFNYCDCGLTYIDGGDSYTRVGYSTGWPYVNVDIDMINEEIFTEEGARVPWRLLSNSLYPLNGQSLRPKIQDTPVRDRWPY